MAGNMGRVITIAVFVLVVLYRLITLVQGKCSIFDPPVQYDERQLAARGQAFQVGFFTMFLASGLSVVGQLLLPGRIPALAWQCGGVLLGAEVFLLTAIHKDALLGLLGLPIRWILFFFVVGGTSLLQGIFYLKNVDDSALTWTELALGVFFLVTGTALLLHQKKLEKEQEDR